MRFTSLLIPAFASLVTTAQASTSYGCWSDRSATFHNDCNVAYTSLVMQWTGSDNNAWIPPYSISWRHQSCTATIKGTGNVVWALNLIASFDQLGARCQNGYFYYDAGWLDANIQGHAGWKREISSAENETETASLPASIQEENKRATSHWVIQENVTYSTASAADIKMHLEEARSSLRRLSMRIARRDGGDGVLARAMGGTYLGSISNNGKIFAMYRAATVVLNGLTPNSRDLAATLVEWMGDAFDGVITSTTAGLINTGADGIEGAHSVSASIAAQLSHVSNWRDLFNYFGSGTDVVVEFMERATNDWANNGYTAAVYHVYDTHGEDVMISFMINGLAGVNNALPAS
ncbi:hypothetical protein BKA65DRAFT_472977 [Rhexocercosporidium sp. MPI-PUGE-AT-0058]|nr:hypothetical protein BKA65DRAFT_472977 [Rhexocercosporidium sp. MPI-PUGE-AT-0058]